MHFDVLKKCSIRAGILDESLVRIDYVGFGVVLGEDKKKFKTRSGDTVRLVELLDEGKILMSVLTFYLKLFIKINLFNRYKTRH